MQSRGTDIIIYSESQKIVRDLSKQQKDGLTIGAHSALDIDVILQI